VDFFNLLEHLEAIADLRHNTDSDETVAVYLRQAADVMLEYINSEELNDVFAQIIN